MSNHIDNQTIDATIKSVGASTKELNTLLTTIMTEILNDRSRISSLSYATHQLMLHAPSVKTAGLMLCAKELFQLEWSTNKSSFSTNKYLDRLTKEEVEKVISAKNFSPLLYKTIYQKKEESLEAAYTKAVKQAAKKAIKASLGKIDLTELESLAKHAILEEFNYFLSNQ